jgi:hypothetical protein
MTIIIITMIIIIRIRMRKSLRGGIAEFCRSSSQLVSREQSLALPDRKDKREEENLILR